MSILKEKASDKKVDAIVEQLIGLLPKCDYVMHTNSGTEPLEIIGVNERGIISCNKIGNTESDTNKYEFVGDAEVECEGLDESNSIKHHISFTGTLTETKGIIDSIEPITVNEQIIKVQR